MKKAAALPLFGDAYLADTRHLSLEEHGAYLQLMLIAWRSPDCALPDDDRRLAQMLGISGARWRKLKPSIMAFWTLDGGKWTQGRLLKERKFVDEKRAKNSDAAHARWNAQAIENKETGECERITERTCERNAPPPPPLKKEREGGGKPPTSYAFFGRTIRLKPNDLERWRATFHAIPDIMAELTALDAWFEEQSEAKRKSWFHTTAGALSRKHQEILAAKARAEDDDDAWSAMP